MDGKQSFYRGIKINMKKYSIIIIAAPSAYTREILADGWEPTSNGYTYFYKMVNGSRNIRSRNIIFVCPTGRMIIEKIEEVSEMSNSTGKIKNEESRIS